MTDYDDDDDDDDDEEAELLEQLCDEILAIVHGRLEVGPISIDSLVALVRLSLDPEELDDEELFGLVDELVAESEDTWRTVSGIVCLIDQFLPGRLFTHRVTDDELRRDVLDVTPDLVAVDFGFGEGLDKPDESAITRWLPFQRRLGIAEYGSFVGPRGWLAGVLPDALVTMQRDEYALSLQIAGPIGDGDREVAVLRSTFDSLCQSGRAMEVFELVVDAVAENPDVFRLAVPPMSELLARAGLRVEGAWVGRADEVLVTRATRHAEANFERLSTWYQMDDCCLAAMKRVARAFEANALDHTDRPGDWPRLVADLTHGPTVAALADWVLDDADDLPNPRLDQFAALLLNDSATRAAGLYLRGVNELRRGRAGRALEDLRESFSLDPSAPWSGNLLAALLGDAGEYMEALQTRRRIPGSEHDHQVKYLSKLLRPFLASGRNDRCPCDSGRKYKQCCAARPRLSLRLRARLRVHQLFSFAVQREHRHYFTGIIDRIAESGCSSDDLSAMRADMFVHDLAVVDGGLVRVYLEQRGEIIPADERAWLEAWSHERRSLFEVIEASPGSFLGRDVIRGGEVRVTTIAVALQSGYESDAPTFEPGLFLLARVGEVEGEHIVIGSAMSVNLKNRASLISLLDGPQSVDALAGWYGSLFAPPHVTNTEGEELVVIREGRTPVGAPWRWSTP